MLAPAHPCRLNENRDRQYSLGTVCRFVSTSRPPKIYGCEWVSARVGAFSRLPERPGRQPVIEREAKETAAPLSKHRPHRSGRLTVCGEPANACPQSAQRSLQAIGVWPERESKENEGETKESGGGATRRPCRRKKTRPVVADTIPFVFVINGRGRSLQLGPSRIRLPVSLAFLSSLVVFFSPRFPSGDKL